MKNVTLFVMIRNTLKKRFAFFLSLTVIYLTVMMLKDLMKFAWSDYAVSGIVIPIFYLGGFAAWMIFSIVEAIFCYFKNRLSTDKVDD